MEVSTAVWTLLLTTVIASTLGEKHSLYYIYSALSKDVGLPGIHKFTALGLLDDREIDYYNSKIQEKIPKQDWMREKMADDYWEKGTQSRKSKEQWFNVNVGILMKRMNHSETDMHVLQWRHGCEIDTSSGGVKFLRGIDEYSYDGSEFLAFDDENLRWIAPVAAAEPTKRKWDDVPILNQYTKGYLEKECVDWLTKFMEYGKEELRNHSPPKVHAFAKTSVHNSRKLSLTCMATGFYPKDVELCVRKYRTSLPEHLLTSSGVRPNGDGTYQLRKSVEINGDDPADYDCFVNHSTLKEPVFVNWKNKNNGQLVAGIAVVAVVVLLLLLAAVLLILKRKGIIGGSGPEHAQAVPPLDPDIAQDVPASVDVERSNGAGLKARGSEADSGHGSGSSSGNSEGRGSSESSLRSSEERIDTQTPLLPGYPNGQVNGEMATGV